MTKLTFELHEPLFVMVAHEVEQHFGILSHDQTRGVHEIGAHPLTRLPKVTRLRQPRQSQAVAGVGHLSRLAYLAIHLRDVDVGVPHDDAGVLGGDRPGHVRDGRCAQADYADAAINNDISFY